MRTMHAAGLRGAPLLAAVLLGAGAAHAECTAHMPTIATVVSARDSAGLGKSTLAMGRPTAVTLAQVAAIRFPVRPEKTDGPYAGLVAFDVPQAGAFRIALGGRAWLDVVEGRATVASVAHQHGAACSGIAKEVTFPLVAGRHAIEITASATPDLAILVTPTD